MEKSFLRASTDAGNNNACNIIRDYRAHPERVLHKVPRIGETSGNRTIGNDEGSGWLVMDAPADPAPFAPRGQFARRAYAGSAHAAAQAPHAQKGNSDITRMAAILRAPLPGYRTAQLSSSRSERPLQRCDDGFPAKRLAIGATWPHSAKCRK